MINIFLCSKYAKLKSSYIPVVVLVKNNLEYEDINNFLDFDARIRQSSYSVTKSVDNGTRLACQAVDTDSAPCSFVDFCQFYLMGYKMARILKDVILDAYDDLAGCKVR